MLSIPPVQLAYILEKSRAFDAETASVDTDSGSNPSDDNEVAILEATADNPIQQELSAALNALDDEQRIEIIGIDVAGPRRFRSQGMA